MQRIAVLGSTGSVGTTFLQVIRLHRMNYQISILTAQRNVDLLIAQYYEFYPAYLWVNNPINAAICRERLSQQPVIIIADETELLAVLASDVVDIVLAAIAGSAGLLSTYTAAHTGKKILLANKESLVAAGKIITQAATASGAKIIPVDSEHSAIFQVLPYNYSSLQAVGVERLVLTASGGPFLTLPSTELVHVTAIQALKHPTWQMGQKISIDSATLMNKGFELIEAKWLFNAATAQLTVVIHPQSIIHSLVEYIDGSVIAQLGMPDMQIPLAYALSAPDRICTNSAKLDYYNLPPLTFAIPDLVKFPCLQLAQTALAADDASAAIINSANEIAVTAFLQQQCKFYDIPQMIEAALAQFHAIKLETISDILILNKEVELFLKKHYQLQL
jgi:1-deoxy-D-xylulose-5-phosphate reductoisomerase